MELEQLQEFDQEVLAHPANAQSYATNQFLDALSQLISIDAETEDELKNVKDALRAFATVLPHVFKTVCQNEAETRMWETTTKLTDLIETKLVDHTNPGVRINAFKCLQILIRLYSKPNDPNKKGDFSLTSVRQNHRLLDITQLEEKGQAYLRVFLDLLKSNQSSAIITAVVNCLVPIVKRRSQFRQQIIEGFVNVSKSPPSDLSTVQKRCIEKIIKIALTTLIRTESLASYRNEFISAFSSVGGNPAIFQSRQQRERERERRDEEKRSKRHLGNTSTEHSEKRTKLSHQGNTPPQKAKNTPPPPPPQQQQRPSTTVPPVQTQSSFPNGRSPLANFDITTLPLNIVIEICLAVLQSVPEQTIREKINMLPPGGLVMPNNKQPQQPLIPSTLPPSSLPATINTNANAGSIPASGKMPPFSQQQQQQQPAVASSSSSAPPVSRPSSSKKHDLDQQKSNERETKRPKLESPASTPDTKITSTITKSRVPLASVQERASQSLKMQPYELAAPKTPARDQQLELLKMSLQRIFDAEDYLQPKGNESTNGRQPTSSSLQSSSAVAAAAAAVARRSASDQPFKTLWSLLIAKLVTLGTAYDVPNDNTNNNNQQEEEDDKKVTNMTKSTMDDSNPNNLKEMLIDFVVADLSSRHELALEWLHQEFLLDTAQKRQDPDNYKPTYFKWLQLLLQKGISTLEAKDKTLTKLMLDAPSLNSESIDLIRRYMREESTRFVSCVSTLRDLVSNRPPIREICLNVLLDYCINPDVKMRSTSIVAVKKWVPDHQDISPKVESFAIQALHTLTQPSTPDDDNEVNDENGDTEMKENNNKESEKDEEEKENDSKTKEQEVVRHAELFFALCARKNELLDELFNVYIHASEQVQRFIRKHIFNLIKSIGMNSTKLLDTIRHFPPGGETLVIRILVTLCDTVRPTPELVSAVKSVYQERNLDAKFLIPIVSGLGKEDLRHNLSKIVQLLNNSEAQRSVVKTVFSRIVSSSATVAAPMTPTELLLALHEMEENVPLSKAAEAISVCFQMPDTFEAKHVSAALRHLSEQPKIPLLLMVTMIRTVAVYKSLVQFILQLLEKLTKKKVWTYPKLWDGFVKCIEKTQPESVKMVANLPQAQLKDILLRIPSIQSPLREHAERNQQVKVLVLMNEMGLIHDEDEEEEEEENKQVKKQQNNINHHQEKDE